MQIPMLDESELYGSKLVAAMDRQHPRDIFDVMKMLEMFGWKESFIDCFVAYLAGHNRPVHEVLFPRKRSLEPVFTNEFAGMPREPIELTALQRVQDRLIVELPSRLTDYHREFLISLVQAEPRWDLMPFERLERLPALQWKLTNLRRLANRNRSLFETQREALVERFR
jgi:hypothetical protein